MERQSKAFSRHLSRNSESEGSSVLQQHLAKHILLSLTVEATLLSYNIETAI